MSTIRRQLNSVGKGIFVQFYEEFQELAHRDSLTREDKKPLAKKLFDSNPDADSLDAQFIRINCALKIFKKEWEREALEDVVASTHYKVTPQIKQRAKELLG